MEKKGAAFFTRTIAPNMFHDKGLESAALDDLSAIDALAEDEFELEDLKCTSGACKMHEGESARVLEAEVDAPASDVSKPAEVQKLQGHVQNEGFIASSGLHLLQDLLLFAFGLGCFHAWRYFTAQRQEAETRLPAKSDHQSQTSAVASAPNSDLDVNALVQSMYSDNKQDIRKLLDRRSVNDCDSISCCTALHAAAHCNCVPAAEALLSKGADIDVRDVWDETPLHFAARAGHAELCELLLKKGAQVNPINADDWTPLLVAAKAGKSETFELLLDHGAHTGGVNEEDVPPSLIAQLQCRILRGSS
jgi:hypothetical protein